jgi:magnesium transporter
MNYKALKNHLKDMHAHDLAGEFLDLDQTQKERIYHALDDQKLAEMVSYLETDEAAIILAEFDLEKQKVLVEMMEPDDAVDIILELEDQEQEDLLSILDETSDVMQLIHYDEDETGAAMTNAIITITPEMDVKQATKKVILEAPDVESIQTIFVVDDNNHYLGVVKLKDLLKTKSPAEVSALVQDCPTVFDKDLITQSVQAIRNYAIYEIPVVNEQNKLVGMLTLDDALDIYQEEAQEDFEKLAALPETLDLPPIKTAFHRLPWLITLLVMFIPISLVTSFFEQQGVLASFAILMFFQPLILGSAGNVATQTLAVTLKTMATDEKNIAKNSIIEIVTGLINGFIIGLLAFAVSYVFALLNQSFLGDPFMLGLVVGLSLWFTVFFSPLSAILIPVSLRLIKADPAAASGPFITTFIDVMALFIYFGLATLLLGGL